ncbi:hypothetical protein LARI1_G008688 [Lachnellula arida]|uniref:Uncharacterized protein n=1 Tax=Lachnellula arida TaxID=1316785 RepID=A0A8T9B5W8_9HELO|nr:hypothetical protein LARI1_G008688 [Lachnellula arida]
MVKMLTKSRFMEKQILARTATTIPLSAEALAKLNSGKLRYRCVLMAAKARNLDIQVAMTVRRNGS